MNFNTLGIYRHQPKGRRSASTTPQYTPPCPWKLTYLANTGLVTEEITARYAEDAALLIGRGIPVQAEFDDRGTGSYFPVHISTLSKLWNNPVLARKQNELDELEDDHA